MSTPACWSWPVPPALDVSDARAALSEWQAGRCAHCGKRRPLLEDHDHMTGLTRGLLCRGCNGREARRSTAAQFNLYRERPPTQILGLSLHYRPNHAGAPMSLRLPRDTWQKLQTYADRERRSLSSAVNYLLDRSLDSDGRAIEIPTRPDTDKDVHLR